MNALTVVLALLAALANAAASVFWRRAALAAPRAAKTRRAESSRARERVRAARERARAAHRRYWLAGAAAMALAAAAQAAALAVGSLSLVQPLMTTELLFTLAVGAAVFHRPPDRITWASFLALAAGLALFLASAAPVAGHSTAAVGRWAAAGAATGAAVLLLAAVAHLVRGAPRAALLGLAAALSFAATAAVLKEVTGRLSRGLTALVTDWPLYALALTGVTALVLLRGAFRAGTLVASQPALTLGDALTSMALGWALFGERIALGPRLLPEAVGVALIAAGSIGLARAPTVSGDWDTGGTPSGQPPRTASAA
ncbi:DMT family transporter [Streptomyces echinoruber]|uniref:DMT family transporter n=1 Tax=Streptomyces echinoruber TaxID=68898 RepID=UPI00167D95D1|nr:DMT family transporter [Streptomyces echinoruber]